MEGVSYVETREGEAEREERERERKERDSTNVLLRVYYLGSKTQTS